jgi:hypothetical protein
MNLLHSRKYFAALTVLTIAAAFGLGETRAQAQLFGGQYRVKIKERGHYPRGVLVSPYVPTAYVPTTYIQAAPVVVSETQVYRPAPVVHRRVIQSAPVVETRLVQPAPVIERRVIQPPPVVQTEMIQPAPVVERQTYYAGYPY